MEEISKLIASALSVKQDGCTCRQKIYKILKLDFDKLQKEVRALVGVFGLNTFDAHLHALGGMCVFTLVH